MASLIELYSQYKAAKLKFLESASVKLLPACPLNGIPVFCIDLSPESTQQLANVRELDRQIREIENSFGTRSDPQTGNYAAFQ